MSDDFLKMREFIDIALLYSDQPVENKAEILQEDIVQLFTKEEVEHPLVPQLRDLVLKLRSHLEDDDNQDMAIGVETGMNRAADMIENLLRLHGDQFGG